MKNKFNTFVLEKLLEQFRKKYGRNSLITEVTYLMLQTDDTLRPDFLNLKERLPPYSQVQQFIMSEGNQQPTSRLHQAAPNVVMEKASYVENPMSMKDSAPLKPFIKSDQIEAIAPRLPGQDTQYEYPSRQKNGLGMEEIHNQGTRHINNQNQPYHIENYNQGNGDFKRGTTDSEVQKNRSE